VELLFEFFGDIVFGVLADTLSPSAKERLCSAFLLFLGGILLGLLSGLALPERLLPRPRTPGLSLLASPIGCGIVMRLWGDYRRERGHPTTPVATFLGAAAFAFGAALGRFVLIQAH
jgi:hypothetical protein